ncbi:MAG TPA: DUF4012 domain-containing protein [Ktedonobacteraceae bacterium]|nr:DUF4012 domain-containing protein [Ktedonobacteraceae bacterium]
MSDVLADPGLPGSPGSPGLPDALEAPGSLDGATPDFEAVSEETAVIEAVPLETPPAEAETTPIATIPETAPPVETAVKPRRLHWGRQRIVSIILLAIIVFALLPSTVLAVFLGWNAYSTYSSLRTQAYGGVEHLLNIKTIFTGVKTHPSGLLDAAKLRQAQKELAAAHQNFQQVQYTLNHAGIINAVTQYAPQYGPQITSARAASQIGLDVTSIGQKLISTALALAPTFRGSLLTPSTKPLVTPAMLNLIGSTIDALLPGVNDIQAQSRLLSLNALPISAKDRDEFAQLIQALPQAETDLVQVRNLLGAAGWILGVDQPRTFLVQTMDRAELRPTGGFTGQYGELQINAGRVAPFSLRDISLVEYVDTSKTIGQQAPPQYRSWWPYANWGLRDSNLSADFPTSAQIAIDRYKLEVGHQVDGVILFTPFLIEHILQVVGPIQVPAYNDVITAQNLEERLHYYQQDNAGIYKQIHIQPGDTSTSDRKRFTSLLAKLLIDKVRHSPPDELIAIGRQVLNDLKTKDLEIYVSNPQVEALLTQYGDAAQVDRSTTHDGLYVVQANISASKASQYVRTIMHDTVTLDANGGATHVMQLRLVYTQIGPVYGYDTYRDYVRVYVPPGSKFLSGDGFDTGVPLCGGAYVACPLNGVYSGGQLLCPAGLYQPGAAAPSISDPDGGHWHPLDTIGPPTNMQSDEPGRAMFGGLVVVPKNCGLTVTLSWYVPPMGHAPYSLLVQRQAGTFPELDLTVLPTPGDCAALKTSGLHFDGLMSVDTSFTLKPAPTSRATKANCYPQPGV